MGQEPRSIRFDRPVDVGAFALSIPLLSLPRAELKDGRRGVTHHVAHNACAVLAGNRFGGYLSTNRLTGEPVNVPMDGLLTEDVYYFFGAGGEVNYPATPDFSAWQFPHAEWDEKTIWGWRDPTAGEAQGFFTKEAGPGASGAIKYVREGERANRVWTFVPENEVAPLVFEQFAETVVEKLGPKKP